jgi:Kef-type K+ transport system membrane component KefB
MWIDLIVLCGVALVSIGLAQYLARFRVPEVSVYLLVGLLLGPHVLRLVDTGVVERSSAVPELLLGFVAFMLGERLTTRAIARQGKLFPVISILALVIPFVLVAAGVYYGLNAPLREALVLGLFAMAGAPATVLAVGSCLSAKGTRHDLLATLAASDNVFVVVAYGVAAPFLVAGVKQSWTVTSALSEVGITLLGGLGIGLVGGWILLLLTKKATADSTGGSMAASLLVVATAVATSHILGASGLIACAVAGITVATVQERRESELSTFRALSGLEDIVYVFFFVFAGTELVPGALLSAGTLAAVYIVLRAVGKVAAGAIGGLLRRDPKREVALLGVALLPQAGVVVGLALDASARFPYVGAEMLSVVLAALIVFELVGPITLRSALTVFTEIDAGERDGSDCAVPQAHPADR